MNRYVTCLDNIHIQTHISANTTNCLFILFICICCSTWTDGMEPQRVCSPLIDVAKHLGNLQYAVWEKMKYIAPYSQSFSYTSCSLPPCSLCQSLWPTFLYLPAPVTLDPRTAGRSLSVSSELNMVHINRGASEDVAVPANPERFHPYSCILAREGFDSGVHCWDIEVFTW